jgi:hypothetical protein
MAAVPFSQFAAESFHSEVHLIWRLEGLNSAVAKFTVDEVRVEVMFEKKEPNGAWYVSFNNRPIADPHSAVAIFNGVFQATEEFLGIRQSEAGDLRNEEGQPCIDLRTMFGMPLETTYLRREARTLERLGYMLGDAQRVPPFEYRLSRVKPLNRK